MDSLQLTSNTGQSIKQNLVSDGAMTDEENDNTHDIDKQVQNLKPTSIGQTVSQPEFDLNFGDNKVPLKMKSPGGLTMISRQLKV